MASFDIASYSHDSDVITEISQTDCILNLKSNQSSLKVRTNFVDDTLRLIYITDYEGAPLLKEPVLSPADSARKLLESYQAYTGDSFYSDLALTISDVDQKVGNETKIFENIKLQIKNNSKSTDFIWNYIDGNNVSADIKNVILSYEEGQLKYFLNNWPLYTISGIPVISVKDAQKIAIEAVNNYSYNVTKNNVVETISGFEINSNSLGMEALSYLNYANASLARNEDPYTLYPLWYVPIGFKDYYPGDVAGLTVAIWADTGQISGINPLIVDSDLYEESVTEQKLQFSAIQNSVNIPLIVLIFLMVVVLSLTLFKAKYTIGKVNTRMFNRYKRSVLCALVFITISSLAIPSVNAGYPNSFTNKSEIYACVDTPDGFFNSTANEYEKDAAEWLCGQLSIDFQTTGYATSNNCGDRGTYVAQVLNSVQYDENTFDRTAIFHFGHQSGFAVAYQDNVGTPINDTDIYARTTSGKHDFVFLWVCVQAMTPERWNDTRPGMPVAWTHRDNSNASNIYMSSDGYSSPDQLKDCYISFSGISPMISNFHTPTFNTSTVNECKFFIEAFYNYTLLLGYTINDALDQAAIDFFGYDFDDCPLGEGYFAWCPNTDNYEAGCMHVYGNGDITIANAINYQSGTYGLSPTLRLNGNAYSVGVHGIAFNKTYTVDVDAVSGYTLNYVRYTPTVGSSVDFNTPYNLTFNYPGSLTAYFVPNVVYRYLDVWLCYWGLYKLCCGVASVCSGSDCLCLCIR